MACINDGIIFQYDIADKNVMKFPYYHKDYTFTGKIKFCYPRTTICKQFDLVADANSIDEYKLFEGKINEDGKSYGTPESFQLHTLSRYFTKPADDQSAYKVNEYKYHIPLTNYFSGHDIDFSVWNPADQRSENVFVEIDFKGKFDKQHYVVGGNTNQKAAFWHVAQIKDQKITRTYYYFGVSANSGRTHMYIIQEDGEIKYGPVFSSNKAHLRNAIVTSGSDNFYVALQNDDGKTWSFDVYDLDLVLSGGSPRKVNTNFAKQVDH